MRIDNGSTDVFYKGHGLIERATPSNSVGHVLLHELRHLQEFQNEARVTGREVVNPRISIDYEFRDGKLVAVSGEARANLVPERTEGSDIFQNLPPQVKGPEKTETSGLFALDTSEIAGADEKMHQTLQKLKSIKGKIENKLESLKVKSEGEPAVLKAPERNQKIDYLNDKLRMLDFLINRVEAEKSAEMQEDLFKKLLDVESTFGLIQTAYGSSEKPTYGETEVPSRIKNWSILGLSVDIIV